VDTRDFLRGWRPFLEGRRDRYGSQVFRTWIGSPAITVLDVRGFQVLFDPTLVRKPYGFGPAIPRRDMVGGIVPTVFENGHRHRVQKRFLLEFLRRADASLEATLVPLTDESCARWAAGPLPFDLGEEGDVLMVRFLFQWLLGGEADPADVRTWIGHVLSPFPWDVPLPPSPEPARGARDRLLDAIRAAPDFPAATALGAEMGRLDSEEVARHLLFLLCFNAWGGLQGLWRSLLAELSLRPELVRRIRGELRAVSTDAAEGGHAAARTPALTGSVLETLRLHSPVPFAYGIARRDFVLRSSSGPFRVREGELIQGSFWMAARDPEVFADPEAFDPERYADPAARRGLLWAHGPGDVDPGEDNKTCAGKGVVPRILACAASRVVAGWEWTLQTPPRWSDRELIVGNGPIEPLLVDSFAPTP